MEDLAEFFANVIEFLVGGMLFAGAVVFLLASIPDSDLLELDADWLRDGSTAVSLGLVALAYAVGVVAESLSRASMEWILIGVTDEVPEFVNEHQRAADDAALAAAKRDVAHAAAAADPHDAAASAAAREAEAEARASAARAEARKSPAKVRDLQRVSIMDDVGLHSEVQGQLKRLRLERVVTLGLAVVVPAFALRGELLWTLGAAAATVGMGFLVRSRCKRYCGAIVRGFTIFTARQAAASGAGHAP